jgi:hypothetical protein
MQQGAHLVDGLLEGVPASMLASIGALHADANQILIPRKPGPPTCRAIPKIGVQVKA